MKIRKEFKRGWLIVYLGEIPPSGEGRAEETLSGSSPQHTELSEVGNLITKPLKTEIDQERRVLAIPRQRICIHFLERDLDAIRNMKSPEMIPEGIWRRIGE